MDRKQPRKDDPDDLSHFQSEAVKATLYVVRQLRLAFEAAASSKWMTWWVLAGPVVWAAKSLLLP